MNDAASLGGIWSAVLTPVDAEFAPDSTKAIPYYRDLLQNGCDGLNVLGTTGEAMSLGVRQRTRFMEQIAASDLPTGRIMTGTGAAALADAALLTQAAFDLGFTAALVMPPFFYRDLNDDDVVRFFGALLERVNTRDKFLVLYNFPKMSGVTFTADLVDRLHREFPGVIGGMKDSSNDRALQRQVIERRPELAVFPASEEYVVEAKTYGAAGCISGSVCLWPSLAKIVFTVGNERDARELAEKRRSLPQAALIAAVRERVAKERNDEQWARSIPPLGGR